MPSPEPTQHGRSALWLGGALIAATLLAALWFTGFVTAIGDRLEHDRILALARTVTATLDAGRIAALSGDASDAQTPQFDDLRRELRRARDVNPDFRFVYLMRPETDGGARMVFLADAESPESPDYSAPGDPYDGPSEDLWQVWHNGVALVQSIHEDDWGSWVTAVSPVRDATGTVVAVLGMDMRADAWNATQARYRLFALAIAALVLALEGLFLIGLARQRRHAARLATLNARLAHQLEALERAQRRLELADAVFRHTGEAIAVLDPQLRVVSVNPGFTAITGFSADAVEGKMLPILGEDFDDVVAQVRARLRGARHWDGTLWAVRANGGRFPIETSVDVIRDSAGNARHLAVVFRDITVQKRLEDRLRELSQTDALTLLANRRSFDDALEEHWRRAMRSGEPVSLLMIDVDFFKAYNDIHGHPAGDRCLQQVAEVLRNETAHVMPEALVARYGGEEFAIILPGADITAAAALGEGLRARVQALGIPHGGNADIGRVTISVGASTRVPPQSADVEELMSSADQALYRAKRDGRNSVVSGAD